MKKYLLFFAMIVFFPLFAGAGPVVVGNKTQALSGEQCKEIFLTDLATDYYINEVKRNGGKDLDEEYIFNFLEQSVVNDQIPDNYICALKAIDEESEEGIHWSEVKAKISNVLDETNKMQGALICQNNRVWQVGIEGVLWITTVVAAVYSLGAGGVAIQAGKIAMKSGLKFAAGTFVKATGRKVSWQAIRTLAVKGASRKALSSTMKKITANIFTKIAAMGVATGAVWFDGQAAKSASLTFYSLLESGTDTEIINCQRLHKGNCYRICGSGAQPNDDLNQKVFIKQLGYPVCVSSDDTDKYSVHKMKQDGTKAELLNISAEKMASIIQKVSSDAVANAGECDWKANDIDMYVGAYLHDPMTLEISTAAMPIIQIIRIDD